MPRLKTFPWQDAIAKRNQRLLLKLIQEQDGALQEAIRKAMRDVEKALKGLGGKNVGAVTRRALYLQRRGAIVQAANSLWVGEVAPTVTGYTSTVTQAAANGAFDMLQVLTQGLGPGRAGLLADSMLSSATKTFSDLRSRLLNGIDLSPRIYRNAAYMTGKIDDVVNSGILLGKGAAEIAKDVSGFINPRAPGGIRYNAMRLGRTELNNAFHATSVQTYAQSPYVVGVQWVLSNSHGRPDECDNLAGEDFGMGPGVWRPADVPSKPHPQCFCYTVPVTPDVEKFQRDLMNGRYNCG